MVINSGHNLFSLVYLVVQMRRMTFSTGRIRDEKSKRLHFPVQDRRVVTLAVVQPRKHQQSTNMLKNPNLITRRIMSS